MITIEARNNLDIPIRLTLVNVNDGRNQSRILVTIGPEGVALRDFYNVCIDADVPPSKKWQEVGSLTLEAAYHISIRGKESIRSDH